MTIQIALTCRPGTALVCATLTDFPAKQRWRASRRANASRTAALQHPSSRPNPAFDRQSGLESP